MPQTVSVERVMIEMNVESNVNIPNKSDVVWLLVPPPSSENDHGLAVSKFPFSPSPFFQRSNNYVLSHIVPGNGSHALLDLALLALAQVHAHRLSRVEPAP